MSGVSDAIDAAQQAALDAAAAANAAAEAYAAAALAAANATAANAAAAAGATGPNASDVGTEWLNFVQNATTGAPATQADIDALNTAIATKANSAAPTFTGNTTFSGPVALQGWINTYSGFYVRGGNIEIFRDSPNTYAQRWAIVQYSNPGNASNLRLYIHQPQQGGGMYLGNGSAANSGWQTASDERLKDDVQPVSDCLNKVLQIRAVTYTMKDQDDGVRLIGFIAQDWLKVQPEVVSFTETESIPDMMGMSYTATIPVLLGAIQELHANVQQHQATIQDLLMRVAALEARVD